MQDSVHQRPVSTPLIFAYAVDVITEYAKEDLMNEVFYADDLVLMVESIGEFEREIFKMEKDV